MVRPKATAPKTRRLSRRLSRLWSRLFLVGSILLMAGCPAIAATPADQTLLPSSEQAAQYRAERPKTIIDRPKAILMGCRHFC